MKCAALLLCGLLSACGLVSEQSFYAGIRANERAKSAGTGQDDKALPTYDRYRKERYSPKPVDTVHSKV